MSTIITLEEVAEFLRVHPSTVYRLLRSHSIPAFKLGSDWRFNQESIERWIIEREAANAHIPIVLGNHFGKTGMMRAVIAKRRMRHREPMKE
jgi:excisionase family DNA binding protein